MKNLNKAFKKMWLRILHSLGLTNLSDEQVQQYEGMIEFKNNVSIVAVLILIFLFSIFFYNNNNKKYNELMISGYSHVVEHDFELALKQYNSARIYNIKSYFDKSSFNSKIENGKKYFAGNRFNEAYKFFDSQSKDVKENSVDSAILYCWKKWSYFEASLRMRYKEVEGLDTLRCKNLRWVLLSNVGYTFINKFGEEITNKFYNKVWSCKNGSALVFANGRFAFIDETGNKIVDWFDHFIGKNGLRIALHNIDDNSPYNPNGFALIERNSKIGVINGQGKIIADCKYIEAERQDKNGLIILTYIDGGGERGTKIIYPNGEML